jgi:F/Y-rich N-terminus/SET domain/PHD-like zinc-binding domain/F/Y rich C-terminus
VNAMEKARSRGAQLKCFGCGRPGATVGCNKPNCSFNYHFPCAKACGAIFTSGQKMFCASHRSSDSGNAIVRESFEAMKTLIVAPEKQKQPTSAGTDKDGGDNEHCIRVGSLTIHALGKIVTEADGFHTDDYIYPEGYVATRIFWSMVEPKTRTVYVCKIERGSEGAVFTITPGDAPSSKIRGRFASQVYKTLVDRVRKVNAAYFSHGDLFSKLPMIRKSRKRFFALNGPQFFGFGLNLVRERLEKMPGIEAVVAPLKPTSAKYRFCFVQPTIDSILDLQRKRAAVAAERALENSSGCARTEGRVAVQRSGGSGRITRALVRSVEEEGPEEAGLNISAGRRKNTDSEKNKLDKKRHTATYTKMKSVPMEDRLVARRSHIHGYGLFTKLSIPKDDMITEYMGEIVRQCIADKREAAYEISGEGSCYMFRLDLQRIVDATMIGCMARFMNHCCQPNAYAKIIIVDTDAGVEKKIAVFANRDIAAGEEITYDYKFPVEDGSLRCSCGAPNCIGRMN